MIPGKPETEKVIPFEFESEYSDIGTFKGTFCFKRLTNQIRMNAIRLKAELLGGQPPASRVDEMKVEAIAFLTHAVIPVPDRPGWLNEFPMTFDENIVYGIFNKLMDYNNSF